ncbi:hypothetical protein DFJ58DRAFT_102853 [Suillus subalutaceus]|uniref:uncharacterized protein n=1 Tax=Suillus subalutaceus TaxID=48586 RepID=UPI001B883E47|nr:uncharacterized protein DFJ58DRAFT_102853 [Suillus subalutaceus]KAG1839746.1 hypothetical protein DFJ58DRAFT_102853 [Suillus subalutaceus]
MAQPGGHWHPNPQLMHQHSIPQGWQGTWPPPAGVALPPNFPGPPPMPPGANTHPHWKAGFWQYNPAHNMNAGPGVSLGTRNGQARAIGGHSSPKMVLVWRTWSVRGATDRDRESTRDAQGDAAPQTPWIWNPPSLLPTDGADRATPTKAFRDGRSSQDSIRSNSTPTSYGPPQQRGSQDSHNATSTGTPVRDYFYSHPASRHGSLDSLSSRSQGLSQHSISSATPPPPSLARSYRFDLFKSDIIRTAICAPLSSTAIFIFVYINGYVVIGNSLTTASSCAHVHERARVIYDQTRPSNDILIQCCADPLHTIK